MVEAQQRATAQCQALADKEPQELDLQEVQWASDAVVGLVAKHLPRLGKHLRSLQVTATSELTGEGIANILGGLGNSELRTLKLTGLRSFSDKELELVGPRLAALPQLQVLDLSGLQNVSASQWAALLSACSSTLLLELTLAECELDDDKAVAVGQQAARVHQLQRLDLHGNGDISGLGWGSLLAGLGTWPLRELDLHGCSLSDARAAAIGKRLRQASSLQKLNLADNVGVLARQPEGSGSSTRQVRERLTATGWVFQVEGLEKCPIEELDLSSINLGGDVKAATAIAKQVNKHQLQRLSLRGLGASHAGISSSISADALDALLGGLGAKLQELDIGGNDFSDVGASRVLTRHLPRISRGLQKLNLTYLQLASPAAWDMVIEGLAGSRLQELSVAGCKLTAGQLQAIGGNLASLQQLDVGRA